MNQTIPTAAAPADTQRRAVESQTDVARAPRQRKAVATTAIWPSSTPKLKLTNDNTKLPRERAISFRIVANPSP